MQLKADVGSVAVHDEDPESELPLISFNVTRPGLAAIKVDKNVVAADFIPQPLEERETA